MNEFDPTLDAIADATRAILDTKVVGVTLFDTPIKPIAPLAAIVLHRDTVNYDLLIQDDGALTTTDANRKSNDRSALVRVFSGEEEYLGEGTVLVTDLPSTPHQLRKKLLKEANSAIHASIENHVERKGETIALSDCRLLRQQLSYEESTNHISVPKYDDPDFTQWIADAQELASRLYRIDKVTDVLLHLQATQGIERIVSCEKRRNGDEHILCSRLTFPNEFAIMSLTVTVMSDKDEAVETSLSIYRNSISSLLNSSYCLTDQQYLQDHLGVNSWEELISYARVARHAKSSVHDAVLNSAAFGSYMHESIGAHLVNLADLISETTFTYPPEKKGTLVCPPFITMTDDPTQVRDADTARGFGSYPYDAEGVPPKKVVIIENGIFTGQYLSHRISAGTVQHVMPELEEMCSNGHSRVGTFEKDDDDEQTDETDTYYTPEPRMSNLIITPVQELAMAGTTQGLVDHLTAKGGGLYILGGGGCIELETGDFQICSAVFWQINDKGERTLLTGAYLTLNAQENLIKGVSAQVQTQGAFCGTSISGMVRCSETAPGAYIKNCRMQTTAIDREKRRLTKLD